MGAKEIFGALAQLDGSKSREDRQKNALNLLELGYQQKERIARREIADYSQDVKELGNVFDMYKTQLADPSLGKDGIAATKKAFNEDIKTQQERYNITEDSDLGNYFKANVSGVNELFQVAERGEKISNEFLELYNNADNLYKDDAHSGNYNYKDADDILNNIETLRNTAFELNYDNITSSLDTIESSVMKKRQVIGRLQDMDFDPTQPFLQSDGGGQIDPNYQAAQQSAKWGDWDSALEYLQEGTSNDINLLNSANSSAMTTVRQTFNKTKENIQALASKSSLGRYVTELTTYPTTENNFVYWGQSQQANPSNTSMLRIFDEVNKKDSWMGDALEGSSGDLRDEGKALYLSGRIYEDGGQWIYADNGANIYQEADGTINPYGRYDHNWDIKRIEANINKIGYDFSDDTDANDRLLIAEVAKQYIDSHQNTIKQATNRIKIPDAHDPQKVTVVKPKKEKTLPSVAIKKTKRAIAHLQYLITENNKELRKLDKVIKPPEFSLNKVEKEKKHNKKELEKLQKALTKLELEKLPQAWRDKF